MNTSSPVTDEWIQQSVLAALRHEDRVHPAEVGVAVREGLVTLSGAVDSHAKRLAAEEAAHKIRGVRGVTNHIAIELPAIHERSDAELAAAASHALGWDALVPADKLDVAVAQGWVTLRGEVERPYQRLDAERVVSRLAGIRGITNLIAVEAVVTPATLKQRIEEAFVRRAREDAAQVTVEIVGGHVTLRGQVRSWREQGDARDAVASAPGVSGVEDRLIVEPFTDSRTE